MKAWMALYEIGAGSVLRSCAAMIGRLVDIVLPPRCIVSGQSVDKQGMIAPEIWAQLDFITAPHCEKCGFPFDFDTATGGDLCAPCLVKPPEYKAARAALRYNDTSRAMILGYKHADQMHAALAFFPWLKVAGQDFINGAHCADIIIPVPLHRWRLLKRRYNQSAVLAQKLGRDVGIDVLVDGLRRVRHTPAQGHMKAKERARNVRKAFVVNPRIAAQIKDKRILLIDDVYTTGATVNECAKVLKKSGAAAVYVLCIARVVRE